MRLTRTLWLLAGAGAAILVFASPALAVNYPMGLDTTNMMSSSYWNYTMGYQFRVDYPSVTVVELGCYTPTPYARPVGLWSSTGTLLAQATTPSSPAGWRFATLATAVPLTQGATYIVAQYDSANHNYKTNSFSTDGRISYVASRYGPSSFTFPTTSVTGTMYGVADIGYTVMPPPPTPATITVPSSSFTGNYTISWSSASTASYYELQEDTNSSFVNPVTLYNGANLSFGVTGRLNGTYYYRVRAGNLGGTSAWRAGSNGCVVTLLPGPASSLTVPFSSTTGNFFVSWPAVTYATSYDLEESTDSGGNWTLVFSGAAMSWSAVGKSDGTYWYRVRTLNAAGNSGWTYGSYASNPPNPPPAVGPGDGCLVQRPPYAPPAISVPFNSTNGVYVISWTASPSGSVSYRLEEDTDAGFGTPTQIYLGLNTSFTVGGGPSPNDPRANGTYYYRVRAENPGGPSGWTIGANGSTVLLPPPPAPMGITVPANSSTGTYTVTWSPSSGAALYQLQEGTDSAFTGAMVVYSGSGTAHNVMGNPGAPPAGTSYYYRVRAWNSSGWSGWTVGGNACLVIVPVPGDVGTVGVENALGGGPAPQPDADGVYYVVWTASSGATTYVVEESTNYPSFAGASTVYTGSGLNVQVTHFGNGTYYYRVKGQNSSGMSANWAVYSTGIQILLPPPTPGNITVPGMSATGNYQVTWTSSATASGYELEESTDGGGSWSPVYSGGSLSYNATSRPDGTYSYRVRASNVSGTSGWLVGATPCVVLFPPAAPAGITVPASSATGIYPVSWGVVGTAARYDLEESRDNQATWAQVYSGSGTTHTVSGKTSGTYWYRVRSWNASGYSATWTTSGNACVIVPPSTPTGLSAPGTSSTGTWTVSWNASSGTVTYTLEEAAAAGGPWTVAYSGASTSYVVIGKTTGTFWYRVSATNGAGTSGLSGTVSCQMVAPPAPGALIVPANSISGYYQVSWGVAAGSTRYVLEEGPTATGPWGSPAVYDGPNAAFYVTGRTNGTYWYRVQGFNAVGGSPVTVSGNGCAVSLAAPNAVSGLTVPAMSATGSYSVSWTSSFGATGYELQEATLSDFSDAYTVYTGSGQNAFLNGRSNGIYYYQVRATNPVGASGYTPGMNGCVVNLVSPGAPGNFTVPYSSFSGMYQVTWTTGSGAMWYLLEEDVDPGFGTSKAVYFGGGLSCWMVGKSNGTYYYRIRSVNPMGQSAWAQGGNGCMVAVVSPAIGLFAGPSNPSGTRERPGSTMVPMLQLGVATGTGGAVRIESVTFRGSGTGNETTGVQSVSLWEDVDGDGVVTAGSDRSLGTPQVYTANDGTVTFGGMSETYAAGSVKYWLVAYDLQGSAMVGEEYRLELTSGGDMTAEDAVWGSGVMAQGAPVQGGLKTLVLTGTGDLEVFLGTKAPGSQNVSPGSVGVVMAQWNLVASSVEGVQLSRLEVWGYGDGNEPVDVLQVRVVEDANGNGAVDAGEAVLGTGSYLSDNGSVSLTLTPALTVPAGGTRKLLAVYDYWGGIAGTMRYGAGIMTTGDLTTTGATSASPVSVLGPPVLGYYATVSTPPPPETKVDPEYSMGGCSGGTGAAGSAGGAGALAPLMLLGAAIWLARRRKGEGK